jgi:hypothetical protein
VVILAVVAQPVDYNDDDDDDYAEVNAISGVKQRQEIQ